ncbi:hypothetical protein RHSIM_Rhsim08G0185800 [Rhododendron simsii]|uniref:Uncharacterized protein n=1 Tax=Rhododendron simsii TaxID=118357 RepID=A0A834LIV8_RHOSS|nr:hypothetical protein RHSIM_Rhsim08G0185800 [Rhododendron simsii]
MPPLHSKFFYFSQGHAEHTLTAIDFPERLPALILCRVPAMRFMADFDTDEAYAKIKPIPINGQDHDATVDGGNNDLSSESQERGQVAALQLEFGTVFGVFREDENSHKLVRSGSWGEFEGEGGRGYGGGRDGSEGGGVLGGVLPAGEHT